MSFISSLAGGILGSNASQNAGNILQQGAQKAQGVISQGQNNSQNFLNNTWQGTQGNFSPYTQLGQSAAGGLQSLLGKGFQGPTSLAQLQATPGYQFALQQGTNAIDQNAAANGTLLSGNTGVALQNYGQGLASQTYQQAYNNALQGYEANLQGLMGGTQIGSGAASSLGYLGNQASGLNTNINLGGSEAQAQQINNAASAQASGTLGSANAWSNALGGIFGGAQGMGGSIAEGLSGGGGFGDVLSSLAGGGFI